MNFALFANYDISLGAVLAIYRLETRTSILSLGKRRIWLRGVCLCFTQLSVLTMSDWSSSAINRSSFTSTKHLLPSLPTSISHLVFICQTSNSQSCLKSPHLNLFIVPQLSHGAVSTALQSPHNTTTSPPQPHHYASASLQEVPCLTTVQYSLPCTSVRQWPLKHYPQPLCDS
jgi:hypothetical protein